MHDLDIPLFDHDLPFREMNIQMSENQRVFLTREGVNVSAIPRNASEVVVKNPEEHLYK